MTGRDKILSNRPPKQLVLRKILKTFSIFKPPNQFETVTQVPGDMRVGIVGGPMAGMEIRLVDWEEGNYRITDKVRTDQL